jgi:Rrf2 family protein
MQITRQADYAVRAVHYLAHMKPGERVATAEVADRQRIPLTFLAKIVSQLSAAGVIRATRGAHGGITLARSPDHVTLLEVVEAIDGPVRLNECVTDLHACAMAPGCSVRDVWCQAQADLIDRLRQTTFGSLSAPRSVQETELPLAVE